MIEAIGDHALVHNVAELKLLGAHGPIATWPLPARVDDASSGEIDFDGDIIGHALLADPPRLALLRASGRRVLRRIAHIDDSWIELIDPTSGEVHFTVHTPLRSLLAFDPTGMFLFGNGADGFFVIDDEGRATHLSGRAADAPLVYNAAGDVAIGVFPMDGDGHDDGPTLFSIDIAAAPRVRWMREQSSSDTATPLAANDTRALLLDTTNAHRDAHLRLHRLEDGAADVPVATFQLTRGAPVRHAWVNRALTSAAFLDDDGTLSTFRARPSRSWDRSTAQITRDILVDIERERVLEAGVGVYLRDLSGMLIRTSAYATRMAFAGTGAAVVLVGGAVNTLDEIGTHLIDGPGNLVEVAPHKRGVIAIDEKDCAHVVDV